MSIWKKKPEYPCIYCGNEVEDRGYECGSCSMKHVSNMRALMEQDCGVRNQSVRKGKLIKFNGKRKKIIDWCGELNLNFEVVYDRIFYRGWTPEKAFTQIKPRKRNNKKLKNDTV